MAYDRTNEPKKGATVYITGRKLETLQATATELGKNCRPIVCDHAEADQIEKLFDQIRKNIIILCGELFIIVDGFCDGQLQSFKPIHLCMKKTH